VINNVTSYRPKRRIGSGAFAAVYESEQLLFGVPVRRVAVKLSHQPNYDATKFRETFADAFLLAEALEELGDPEARGHIIQLYDLGILEQLERRAFVAMEYVHGGSLANEFKSRGKVSSGQLLTWVRQICKGLAGLHELVPPVLHRDLKPDNVLLGIDLRVRIGDFGLAARLLSLGYVAGVAGTPNYMAPETMRGASEPASDVYSIGCILYEGLTGMPPYAQLIRPPNQPEALFVDWWCNQIQTVNLIPPSANNNTVPGWLDDIVVRCLQFNPSLRFRNARTLLEAFDPQGPPTSESKLALARRLRANGDLTGAGEALERALGEVSKDSEVLLAVRRELGEVCAELGEHLQAATHLVEAWVMVDGGGLLVRRDKVKLLALLVEQLELSGKGYQAERYESIRKALHEGRRD
jgi:serine/threonine protein kinase